MHRSVRVIALVAALAGCGGTTVPVVVCDQGVACGEVCVDLGGDARNCGACGHDCLGGACSNGVCQAAVLYTSPTGAPYGVAVDSDAVFFTTAVEGAVYRCDKSDCAGTVTSIATHQAGPSGVATDGVHVYWATTSGVTRCAVSGCGASGPEAFASGQSDPRTIVVFGGRVYWTDHGPDGGVMTCPIGGCAPAPEVFAADANAPDGLAVDGVRVFWTEAVTPGGRVRSCPIAGCAGAADVVAADVDIPQSIASDGHDVFWTNFTGQSAMRCPVGGCGSKPSVLAQGAGWYDGLALDGDYAYFTGGDENGDALLRCAKAGCAAPEVVATGQTRPGKVAVDGEAVYWTTATTVARIAR
jgi:hypothetical protein